MAANFEKMSVKSAMRDSDYIYSENERAIFLVQGDNCLMRQSEVKVQRRVLSWMTITTTILQTTVQVECRHSWGELDCVAMVVTYAHDT